MTCGKWVGGLSPVPSGQVSKAQKLPSQLGLISNLVVAAAVKPGAHVTAVQLEASCAFRCPWTERLVEKSSQWRLQKKYYFFISKETEQLCLSPDSQKSASKGVRDRDAVLGTILIHREMFRMLTFPNFISEIHVLHKILGFPGCPTPSQNDSFYLLA